MEGKPVLWKVPPRRNSSSYNLITPVGVETVDAKVSEGQPASNDNNSTYTKLTSNPIPAPVVSSFILVPVSKDPCDPSHDCEVSMSCRQDFPCAIEDAQAPNLVSGGSPDSRKPPEHAGLSELACNPIPSPVLLHATVDVHASKDLTDPSQDSEVCVFDLLQPCEAKGPSPELDSHRKPKQNKEQATAANVSTSANVSQASSPPVNDCAIVCKASKPVSEPSCNSIASETALCSDLQSLLEYRVFSRFVRIWRLNLLSMRALDLHHFPTQPTDVSCEVDATRQGGQLSSACPNEVNINGHSTNVIELSCNPIQVRGCPRKFTRQCSESDDAAVLRTASIRLATYKALGLDHQSYAAEHERLKASPIIDVSTSGCPVLDALVRELLPVSAQVILECAADSLLPPWARVSTEGPGDQFCRLEDKLTPCETALLELSPPSGCSAIGHLDAIISCLRSLRENPSVAECAGATAFFSAVRVSNALERRQKKAKRSRAKHRSHGTPEMFTQVG